MEDGLFSKTNLHIIVYLLICLKKKKKKISTKKFRHSVKILSKMFTDFLPIYL